MGYLNTAREHRFIFLHTGRPTACAALQTQSYTADTGLRCSTSMPHCLALVFSWLMSRLSLITENTVFILDSCRPETASGCNPYFGHLNGILDPLQLPPILSHRTPQQILSVHPEP